MTSIQSDSIPSFILAPPPTLDFRSWSPELSMGMDTFSQDLLSMFSHSRFDKITINRGDKQQQQQQQDDIMNEANTTITEEELIIDQQEEQIIIEIEDMDLDDDDLDVESPASTTNTSASASASSTRTTLFNEKQQQETTASSSATTFYYIKQHENPSTSAAAAIAAAEVSFQASCSTLSNTNAEGQYTLLSFLNTSPSPSLLLHQQARQQPQGYNNQKSILRKSSAFFTQKILKKKPSYGMLNTKNLEKEEQLIEAIQNRRNKSPAAFVIKATSTTEQVKTREKRSSNKWWRNLHFNFTTRD